jgi:predicted secreted hydrolase
MRSRRACLAGVLLVVSPILAQYRSALPGYHYEFPRDYFNHPDFQTEWWYYTGNVRATDGHRFGFELTFFRQGVDRELAQTTTWDVRDLYQAHMALSDLDGGKFHHAERTNRAGPGLAGINEKDRSIWNGNWRVQWQGSEQKLEAVEEHFELHFVLRSEKAPVIHGENGVSQKADGSGRASHYISMTRLATEGRITLDAKTFAVSGLAWMDHEFFTNQLETNQVGWDWLSLQLDDKTELMLFRIRRKDGSIDPYSAGTFVDAQGASTHLRVNEFTMYPMGGLFTSPVTHAVYPIQWKISVPKLGIEVEARTPLPSQELPSEMRLAPSYWEGAITIAGHKLGTPLTGVGYLEMTGYDRPFESGN